MYQNECSSATARSNGFCTAAAHEVGKLTWPMRSPAVCADGVEGEAASTDIASDMASTPRWFMRSSRRDSLPDFGAADAAAPPSRVFFDRLEARRMNEKLESVLDQFRPGFDADGFDVSVQDVVGRVVALRIVHRPDACEECLIADDMLGPMLATAFRNVSPDITDVRIEHVGRPA